MRGKGEKAFDKEGILLSRERKGKRTVQVLMPATVFGTDRGTSLVSLPKKPSSISATRQAPKKKRKEEEANSLGDCSIGQQEQKKRAYDIEGETRSTSSATKRGRDCVAICAHNVEQREKEKQQGDLPLPVEEKKRGRERKSSPLMAEHDPGTGKRTPNKRGTRFARSSSQRKKKKRRFHLSQHYLANQREEKKRNTWTHPDN